MVSDMVQHSALIAERARNSMISLGYYRPGVVGGEENSRISKRKGSPLTNRCSWARAVIVEGFVKTLLKQFRSKSKQVQVVNLGSGLCSLVRNLVTHGPPEYIVGFDVDTAANRLSAPHVPECCSSRYQYLCGDLRCPQKLVDLLVGCGVNTDLPTVIVMECVLMYLKEEEAMALLEWVRTAFTRAFVVVFDLNSHFQHGKKADGFIMACQQLWSASGTDLIYHGTLKQILESCGWPCCWACDVAEALQRFVSTNERKRVSNLKVFDEHAAYATWLAHYSIAVGCSRREMSSLLTFDIESCNELSLLNQPLCTLGITFRCCKPADVPAVIDLIALARAPWSDIPTLKRFFRNQPAPCLSSLAMFVATVGGDEDIVGVAGLALEGGEIRHVYVHERWRRRGIAKQLMDICIYVARKVGFKNLHLTTVQHMEANLFYDALDWDYVSSTPIIEDGIQITLVNRGKML